MSLELTGKYLEDLGTHKVSEKLKRREFVIQVAEEFNGNVYINPIRLQLINSKIDLLDNFRPGETIKVIFNIKGICFERDGKKTYINNLEARRIERAFVKTSI